jgi:hypothetical protein
MKVTTRAQREALWRLFLRSYDPSYEPHSTSVCRHLEEHWRNMERPV